MSDLKSQKKKKKLQRESIKVMIRFRPTNKKEKAWDKQNKKKDNEVSYLGKNQIKLLNTNGKKYQYGFDTVMTPSTTQRQAFEIVAESVCDEILQGYNGTIFVYGQSGSGKTHTMYGPEEKKDEMDITSFGIIPMACAYIFTILNDDTHPLAEDIADYNVRCQFIEIYNEKLRDLLNTKQTPQIRELLIHKKYVPVMQNVQTETVNNLEECMAAIRTATSNRTVAKTNLNATSSRSHLVLRLIVTIETKDGMKKTGIGNFADLAGSEKVKKTGVVGKQLKEAGNILKSLSALSNVIDSLEKGKKHVPFKDSKLTFMLKNSLGGNCKTTLLICATPHIHNRDETIRSMQFGMRCRNVQNAVCINETKTKQQLRTENERLKKEIIALKSNAIASEQIINEKLNEIEMENFDLLKQNETNEKHFDVLRQQIQQMSVERDQTIERENELNNELQIVQDNYRELTLNVNNKNTRQQINECKQEINDFKTKVHDLKIHNTDIMNENKELNIKNQELNTIIKRLKDEIMTTNDEMNTLRIENNRQQKQMILLKSDLKQKNALKEEINIIQKKWTDLTQELQHKEVLIKQKNDLFIQHKQLNEKELCDLKHELNEKDVMIKQTQTRTNDIQSIERIQVIQCNKTEHDELSLKIENIMIEFENEKNRNKNMQVSLNKLETKSKILRKEKYKIEDENNVLLAEYNDLQNRFDAFKQSIKLETNKYTQNISKLKYRVDSQREDNLKLFSKLKSIEKLQSENENVSVTKLEELEIQTEEQNNTIRQLNEEIKRLTEATETRQEASPSSSLGGEIVEDEKELKELKHDTMNEEKEQKQMDWNFLLNHCHPRTRSSAFVRVPNMKTNTHKISSIKITKPKIKNVILYDDDGDADELDKLDKLQVELKSNVCGIEKYRRKKRKKYKKRNMAKPKQTFDTAELNRNNKLLSPRVSIHQKERKLSKSERIVRQQTLSLGNYFENHLEIQKQKDERMEKVFDAMEAMEKRKASVHRNKSLVKNRNRHNDTNDTNDTNDIPKSLDDDSIYDSPIKNTKKNTNTNTNRNEKERVELYNNKNSNNPPQLQLKQMHVMNRSVSQRNMQIQKPAFHQHSCSQHNLLSQHISDKYHHSYSVHHKQHKKKKRKSKKDRMEENAKLALIYDNEYKSMKRRYQQKKRKRLLSKTTDNTINNTHQTHHQTDPSAAADAYDSDHNDSENVPL